LWGGLKKKKPPKPGKSFGSQALKDIMETGPQFRYSGIPAEPTSVEFLDAPITYTKEKLTSPQFVTQAGLTTVMGAGALKGFIRNVKTYGFGGGLAETAAGASPIGRIKSGTFSETLSKANFEGPSFKAGQERIYVGTTRGGTTLTSYEKLVQGDIAGAYVAQSPSIKIYGGGAYVTPGVRTVTGVYGGGTLGGGGVNLVVPGTGAVTSIKAPTILKGGVSDIVSAQQTTYTFGGKSVTSPTRFVTSRPGGVTERISSGVSEFKTGDVFPTGKPTGISGRDITFSKYGFTTPRFTGTEFDLGKITSGTGGVNIISGGSGKAPSLFGGGTDVTTQQLSLSKLGTLSLPRVSSTNIITPPPTSVAPITTTQQTQQFSVTTPDIKTTQKTQPRLQSKFSTGAAIIQDTTPTTTTRQRTRQFTGNILAQKPIAITQPRTNQIITQLPAQASRGIQRLAPATTFGKFKTPGPIKFPTTHTPTIFPPLPFALPQSPGGLRGLGKLSASRRYKYSPSFKALAFGITGRGKAPKPGKAFTGLELRPIFKKKTNKSPFPKFRFPKFGGGR